MTFATFDQCSATEQLVQTLAEKRKTLLNGLHYICMLSTKLC
jgi:hypothetical protein